VLTKEEHVDFVGRLESVRRDRERLRERLDAQAMMTLLAVRELAQAKKAKDLDRFSRDWLQEHRPREEWGVPVIKRKNNAAKGASA